MSIVIDYTKGFFEAAPSGETVGDIAGSATLDLATGNVFSYTPAADTTFVFSNPPATGTAYGFTLKVTGADVVSGYDLANAVYDSVSFSVAAQDSSSFGVEFKPDGTKMYIAGGANDSVFEYNLSTAWDISTLSYLQAFSVSAQATAPYDVRFKPDGTQMFVVDVATNTVNQYTLSTAWDISTASFSQAVSVSANATTAVSIFFKPDGTKLFVLGLVGDSIYEYDLSSAWDISTASFLQSFSHITQESNARGIFIGPNGDKLFITGLTQSIFEYSLSTPWDISSASYSSISFSVAPQSSSPSSVFFKSDGAKMYLLSDTNDTIYQYTTGTATPATLTYPASVDWPSGTAPTAPASGETDVYTFYTTDGGTTYYGFQVGDAMA